MIPARTRPRVAAPLALALLLLTGALAGAADPARADSFSGYTLGASARNGEFGPAFHFLRQWDRLRLDGCANLTFLDRDRYNHDHTGISAAGAWTYAYMAFGGLLYPEGASGLPQRIVGLVTLVPVIASNSETHFTLAERELTSGVTLSVAPVISTRTEDYSSQLFAPQGNEWLRYSPGAGLALSVLGSADPETEVRHGLDLRIGADRPCDLVKNRHPAWGDWRLSVGVSLIELAPDEEEE